jgi:thiamine biosynthesis lipoprotein
MKQTKILMGMSITVNIVDFDANPNLIYDVFSYFEYVDRHFSPFLNDSEVSKYNRGQIKEYQYSKHLKEILALSEITKKETNGFFNIYFEGQMNPSGLVKGWAIYNASKILTLSGIKNYYIEAGGDIQVNGKNYDNKPWIVGIQNPFNPNYIIKILKLENKGIATSGTIFVVSTYIIQKIEIETLPILSV